jgi:hypothetical protein
MSNTKNCAPVLAASTNIFNILRAALRCGLHESWEDFMLFALAEDAGLPDG